MLFLGSSQKTYTKYLKMNNLYYPTGPTTGGRTLVCMCCEDLPMMEDSMGPEGTESCIREWLDEKNYCVESWQMEKHMNECGYSGYELQEMDGAFATLGTVNGMGDVATPGAGGTNADFYNGPVGSGDTFGAKGKMARQKTTKFRNLNDFSTFISKKAKKKK